MDGEGSDGERSGGGTIKGFTKMQKKDCRYYLKKLDYEILRPLFIYDYERSKMQKDDELVEQMLADAPVIGNVYSRVTVRGSSMNAADLKS
jgi:hypothetical protein